MAGLFSFRLSSRAFHCNSYSISLTQVLDLHPVSNNFRFFSPSRTLFPLYFLRELTGMISYPYLSGQYWGTCLLVAWWLGLEAGAETGSACFPGIRFSTPSLAWIYSFGTWNPDQPGGRLLEAAGASGFWPEIGGRRGLSGLFCFGQVWGNPGVQFLCMKKSRNMGTIPTERRFNFLTLFSFKI